MASSQKSKKGIVPKENLHSLTELNPTYVYDGVPFHKNNAAFSGRRTPDFERSFENFDIMDLVDTKNEKTQLERRTRTRSVDLKSLQWL